MKLCCGLVACMLAMVGEALGDTLEDGIDALHRGDYRSAYERLRPLAEQGVAEAQTGLGLMYLYGKAVSPDPDRNASYDWFRLAAAQGDDFAAYGVAAELGSVVMPESLDRALIWLKLASDEDLAGVGAADGCWSGKLYWSFCPQDAVFLVRAARWLGVAADSGDTYAQYAVGQVYAVGDGVQQNFILAYKWFYLCQKGSQNDHLKSEALRGVREMSGAMTPEQIAEAKRLAAEWKPKTP